MDPERESPRFPLMKWNCWCSPGQTFEWKMDWTLLAGNRLVPVSAWMEHLVHWVFIIFSWVQHSSQGRWCRGWLRLLLSWEFLKSSWAAATLLEWLAFALSSIRSVQEFIWGKVCSQKQEYVTSPWYFKIQEHLLNSSVTVTKVKGVPSPQATEAILHPRTLKASN